MLGPGSCAILIFCAGVGRAARPPRGRALVHLRAQVGIVGVRFAPVLADPLRYAVVLTSDVRERPFAQDRVVGPRPRLAVFVVEADQFALSDGSRWSSRGSSTGPIRLPWDARRFRSVMAEREARNALRFCLHELEPLFS